MNCEDRMPNNLRHIPLRNIGKRNFTQKARRNLFAKTPKKTIRFGATTSSNANNTTNYELTHSFNNVSESRGEKNRPLPTYFPTTDAEYNMREAREGISMITPVENHGPLSGNNAARVYAEISAKAEDPSNIEGIILADTRMSNYGKQMLLHRLHQNYTAKNLEKRPTMRKNKRVNRTRQSRRTRVY
jgi:hypothetical protein